MTSPEPRPIRKAANAAEMVTHDANHEPPDFIGVHGACAERCWLYGTWHGPAEGIVYARADILTAAKAERDALRIALADAIRRPMGVIPASAEGLVSAADLDAAEKRRPRNGGS